MIAGRPKNDEVIVFKSPASLARAADRAAAEKLLTRSAWIRGIVAEHLRRVEQEQKSPYVCTAV
jgi:hypothetical protein